MKEIKIKNIQKERRRKENENNNITKDVPILPSC